MNDYKEEFDTVISIEDFEKWVSQNSFTFATNMKNIGKNDHVSLRQWLKMFLLWTEYEENK